MSDSEKIARRVDWGDYSVFLAIAQNGSVSKAADALGRTQPTISKRLDNLEHRLGVPLFSRSTNGMKLTAMGEIIFEKAMSINRSAKDIENLSAQFDGNEEGNVTLHCMDMLSTHIIIPHLSEFQSLNPNIHLTVYNQIQGYDEKDMAQDISIQASIEKPMDFLAFPLASLHFMPMVTQAYEDKYGLPRNAKDGVNHNIMYMRRSGLKSTKERPLTDALRELIDPNLSADSGALILQAVLNGAGISMLPTFIATLFPQLKILDFNITHSYPFWLVQNAHLSKRSRINTTNDWLMDLFDATSMPCFSSDFIHPSEFCNNEIIPPK